MKDSNVNSGSISHISYQQESIKTEEELHGKEGSHDVSTLKKSTAKQLSQRISLNLTQSEGLKWEDRVKPPVQEQHDVKVLDQNKTKTDGTVKLGFKAKVKAAGPGIKKFALTYLKGLGNPFSFITDTKAFQSLKDKILSKFQSKSTKTESKPQEISVSTQEKPQVSESRTQKEISQKTESKPQELQNMSRIQMKMVKKYGRDVQFLRDPEKSPTFTFRDVANSIFQFAKENGLQREECKAVFSEIFNQPSDIKFEDAEKAYHELKETVSSEKRTIEVFEKTRNSLGKIPTKIIEFRPVQQIANRSEAVVRNSQILGVVAEPTKESNLSEKIESKKVEFTMLEKEENGDFKPASPENIMEFLIQYDLTDNKDSIDPSFHKLYDTVTAQMKQFTDPKVFLKEYIQKRLDIIKENRTKENMEAILNDALNLAGKGGVKSKDFIEILKGSIELFKGVLNNEKSQSFKMKLMSLDPKPPKVLSENQNAIKLDEKNFLKGNIEHIADDLDKSLGSLHFNMVNSGDIEFIEKKQGTAQRELLEFSEKMLVLILDNIIKQDSVHDSLGAIKDTIALTKELAKRGNWEGFKQVGDSLTNAIIGKIVSSFPKEEVLLIQKDLDEIAKNMNLAGNFKVLRDRTTQEGSITFPLAISMKDKTGANEVGTFVGNLVNFSKLGIDHKVDVSEKKSLGFFEKKYKGDFVNNEVRLGTNFSSIMATVKPEGGLGKLDKMLDEKMPREYRQIAPLIQSVIEDKKVILDENNRLKILGRKERGYSLGGNIGVGTDKASISGAKDFFVKLNGLKEKVENVPYFKKQLIEQLEKLEAKSLSKSGTWVSNVVSKNQEVKKEYDMLIKWKNEQQEKELDFFANLAVKLTDSKKLSVNENESLRVIDRKEGSEDNIGKSKKSRDAALAFLNKLDDISVGREKECLKILESLGKNLWFQKVLENHSGVADVMEVFQEQYKKNLSE